MKIFRIIKEDKDTTLLYVLGFKFTFISKFKKLNIEKYQRELTLDEKKYYLKNQFKRILGQELNIDNPKSFNEKLQWLKLYDHNPLMPICADKYRVRDYIKEKIGEKYLVSLIGVWYSPDEINFDSLPNQFALKVNWGSGQNIIVKDKSKLNIEETKAKLRNWMKQEANHYYYSFEWAYKDIVPCIYAEHYIDAQNNNDLYDYKIMCYNGVAHNLFVCSERAEALKVTFFDTKWNRLPFIRKYPASIRQIEKPKQLNLMLELAEKLSTPFKFCRVYFYIEDNKLYVGEMTFYPGNGVEEFDPIEWDYKLGELIDLRQQ